MLVAPAAAAGIKLPGNDKRFPEETFEYYLEEDYVHWHTYKLFHQGYEVCANTEALLLENARVFASIPERELIHLTRSELEKRMS